MIRPFGENLYCSTFATSIQSISFAIIVFPHVTLVLDMRAIVLQFHG